MNSKNNKSRVKYVTSMIKQEPTKYFGITTGVDNRMLKWGSNETCELDPGCEENLRNWKNRVEFVSENGVKSLGGTIIVTTPQTSLWRGKIMLSPSMN